MDFLDWEDSFKSLIFSLTSTWSIIGLCELKNSITYFSWLGSLKQSGQEWVSVCECECVCMCVPSAWQYLHTCISENVSATLLWWSLIWTCIHLGIQSLENCQVQIYPISEVKPQLISHISTFSMWMLLRLPGVRR